MSMVGGDDDSCSGSVAALRGGSVAPARVTTNAMKSKVMNRNLRKRCDREVVDWLKGMAGVFRDRGRGVMCFVLVRGGGLKSQIRR